MSAAILIPIEAVMLISPASFIIIGLVVYRGGREEVRAGLPPIKKILGLTFAAGGAGIILFFAAMIAGRAWCLHRLTSLDAAEVTSIQVGPTVIRNRERIGEVIDALADTTVYQPNHGNYADKLEMDITMNSGTHQRYKVAWSLEKPGAVLELGDSGEGFCPGLPEALEAAGVSLPRLDRRRQGGSTGSTPSPEHRAPGPRAPSPPPPPGLDTGFAPAVVTEIRIAGKSITSPDDIAEVLDTLRQPQIEHDGGKDGLRETVDLVIVRGGRPYGLKVAAKQRGPGAVVWIDGDDDLQDAWLSIKLPGVLRRLGVELP